MPKHAKLCTPAAAALSGRNDALSIEQSALQEQVREGFLEHTSQLQRFSVWLQLKDKARGPTFHVLFK